MNRALDTAQKCETVADELEPYFRSGNDVPVTQATIPAELGHRVVDALRLAECWERHAADCQDGCVKLETENEALRHDLERAMRNHNADINP